MAIPLLIEGAIAAASLLRSSQQKSTAESEAKTLEANRPKYQIQKEFGQDVALTESELGQGMSAKAQRAYESATDRGLSSSLSAILKGGGDVNSIGSLYGESEKGRENLAILQDNLRLQQIQNVVSARQRMAGEKQTKWMVDEYGHWKDQAQAVAEARKAAEQGIQSGISSFGSILGGAAQQAHKEKRYDKYFKLPNSGTNTEQPLDVQSQQPQISPMNPQISPMNPQLREALDLQDVNKYFGNILNRPI